MFKDRYVYFALNPNDGLIKIGVSINPKSRIEALSKATASSLELIKAIDGSYKLEKSLHEKFDKHRVRGEWFRFAKEIRDFIDSLEHVKIPPLPQSARVKIEESLEYDLRTFAATMRISRAELIRQIITQYWPAYKKVLSMERKLKEN